MTNVEIVGVFKLLDMYSEEKFHGEQRAAAVRAMLHNLSVSILSYV